ncbi:hypothetical protein LJC56_10275, partial [Christensenellaceae bacterium OttesenSCG-928-K19]|nr:hypothetical protein [Christensenellaceae bacterium OttesenSCG-928-K19]
SFLFYSYFGIDIGSETNELFSAYSNRAYRDLARTIRGIGGKKTTIKYDRKQEVAKLMFQEIISCPSKKREDFDDWHSGLCNKIADIFKPIAELKYGQTQKWLNMTIKYLWLNKVGKTESFFKYNEKHLHIPLDSIILNGLYSEHKTYFVNNDIKWSKNSSWSRIEKDTYVKMQNAFRDYFKKHNKSNPLDWESEKWVEWNNNKM